MRRSMHEFTRWMNQAELSNSQLGTMMRLYYHGDCPISNISNNLGITPAATRAIPEGETAAAVAERMNSAFKRILNRHQTGEQVVVSHMGALAMYLAKLLDDNENALSYATSNCSISWVLLGSEPRLLGLNDTSHLVSSGIESDHWDPLLDD